MNMSSHCPYRQSKNLQDALAPGKMRIGFMLGAGCPYSIAVPDGAGTKRLIPDIRGLTKMVNDALGASEKFKNSCAALLSRLKGGVPADPSIEDILSHIRALEDVVRDGTIDGLNKAALSELDTEICRITTTVVSVDLPNSKTPYHQLANWIRGVERSHAVELFTPNYDLLIEQALEASKIPYFDGFVGSKQAFFDLTSMEADKLPPRWARVWKVHGSVNWWRQRIGKAATEFEVVRTDKPRAEGRQMIYPSHLKYDESRRLPYLAMLDRLREFLAGGQAVLVTCGYSFADQHLNEVILHGLRSNPTAKCFGLLYGQRAGYGVAVAKALMHPNLSLLSGDGAVIGTVERDWHSDEKPDHFQHGVSVTKKVDLENMPTNCEFLLDDFKHFGNFLAQQLSRSDDEPVVANAA